MAVEKYWVRNINGNRQIDAIGRYSNIISIPRSYPIWLKTRRPALLNNMRTLKFKVRPTKAFFAVVNQMFRRWVLPVSDHCRALFRCLNCAQRFDYRTLGSSRKLGEAAEYLVDGSEKRICRLSFEFLSPHVIERRIRFDLFSLNP